MKVLLTGGSGDLGKVLSKQLEARGDIPVRLDVRPPTDQRGIFLQGSITDKATLERAMHGIDCVVHIAAWHGFHEFTRQKSVYDFWEVNVTGTFLVFETAVQSGIKNVVYLSSTSVEERAGIYGHTKVLGEEIAHTYAARHQMNVIILRPRAFIPYWNRDVYTSYVDWAKWFWSGAVHIDDVAQAVRQSIDLLAHQWFIEPPVLTIDGAYEYTEEDLSNWNENTFDKYYAEYRQIALRYGLDPHTKPSRYDISETQRLLGYTPQYSLKNLLQELEQYGEAGAPTEF